MAIERTVAIVKPDGVRKDAVNEIVRRYEAAGLTVLSEMSTLLAEKQVEAFYAEHKGKFFFEGLVLSMISGRSHVIHLEGESAITVVRQLNGATNPAEAEPGTIRHDIRSAGGPFNTVHASDSQEAYEREYEIAFDLQCR